MQRQGDAYGVVAARCHVDCVRHGVPVPDVIPCAHSAQAVDGRWLLVRTKVTKSRCHVPSPLASGVETVAFVLCYDATVNAHHVPRDGLHVYGSMLLGLVGRGVCANSGIPHEQTL